MRVGALFRGMLRMKVGGGAGGGRWGGSSLLNLTLLNVTSVLYFYFRSPASKDITEMENKNSN